MKSLNRKKMNDLNGKKRDREERTNRFDGNDEKKHRRFLIDNMSSFHYQSSSSEDESEDFEPCNFFFDYILL